MLSAYISSLIKNWLRGFVEDADNLALDISTGAIVLENLVLNKAALSKLNVPFALHYGRLGKVEIRIPWDNLGVEPTNVLVEDILLLVEPNFHWNAESAFQAKEAVKQARLASANAFAYKRLFDEKPCYFSSLANTGAAWFVNSKWFDMLKNFHVTINNLHIRYEDRVSSNTNFCAGFMCKSIVMEPRSGKTVERMKDVSGGGQQVIERGLEIVGQSIYWNPLSADPTKLATAVLCGRTDRDIGILLREMVSTSSSFKSSWSHWMQRKSCGGLVEPAAMDSRLEHNQASSAFQYIMTPMNINIHFALVLSLETSKVDVRVRTVIPSVETAISELQLREIIDFSTSANNYMQTGHLQYYRPLEAVRSDPAAWWRYAILAILQQIRRNKKRMTWKSIHQRIQDKYVYVDLWCSKLKSSGSSSTTNGKSQASKADKQKAASRRSSLGSSKELIQSELREEVLVNQLYESILKRSKKLRKKWICELRAEEAALLSVEGTEASLGKSSDQMDFRFSRLATSTTTTATGALTLFDIPLLTKEMGELLADMEARLNYEEILIFRALAEEEYEALESADQKELGNDGGGNYTEESAKWWRNSMAWASDRLFGYAPLPQEKTKLFDAMMNDPEALLEGKKDKSSGSGKKPSTFQVHFEMSLHLRKSNFTMFTNGSPIHSQRTEGTLTLDAVTAKRPLLTVSSHGLRMTTIVDTSTQGRISVQYVTSLQDLSVLEQFDSPTTRGPPNSNGCAGTINPILESSVPADNVIVQKRKVLILDDMNSVTGFDLTSPLRTTSKLEYAFSEVGSSAMGSEMDAGPSLLHAEVVFESKPKARPIIRVRVDTVPLDVSLNSHGAWIVEVVRLVKSFSARSPSPHPKAHERNEDGNEREAHDGLNAPLDGDFNAKCRLENALLRFCSNESRPDVSLSVTLPSPALYLRCCNEQKEEQYLLIIPGDIRIKSMSGDFFDDFDRKADEA